MLKPLRILETEGSFLSAIKDIYDRPKANIFDGEALNTFTQYQE